MASIAAESAVKETSRERHLDCRQPCVALRLTARRSLPHRDLRRRGKIIHDIDG
jgi:hypothetical protein